MSQAPCKEAHAAERAGFKAEYEEGVAAQQSDNAEPFCPYAPGTAQYAAFANGFCHGVPRLSGNYVSLCA